MSFFSAAELISIGLTVPTIVLASYVIILWGPEALTIARKRGMDWSDATATDFFIVGVACGFMGQALDNLFWQVAWHTKYLEMEIQPTVFQWGAVANIFSRQLLGIAAAYCHIKSYALHSKKAIRSLSLVAIAATVMGCANMLILYLLN